MLDKIIDALIGEAVDQVLDKLEYSETRLRLLNKFGLKPETPPNDFDGIYNYTLIEYGVGKPKAILQLFKQPEIKQEFQKAFTQNKSFNNQALDNFIQSSDIGNKIQEQNIDYRRELAEFARLFIEIAKRPRTATEILTAHKFDNLQNSLTQVREQINQLTLASGGDNTVKLWDVQTGDCVRSLKGHTHWVRSVAWSGDGLTLASGGDNTVKLWDVQTGDCVRSLEGRLYAGLKIQGVKGLNQAGNIN
jgi:WD40 repeat protein